jgi:hypothetical protein
MKRIVIEVIVEGVLMFLALMAVVFVPGAIERFTDFLEAL